MVGMKIGGMENEERKIGEEMMFFPCLVQERKHKGRKMLKKKNPPGLQIFFLSIREENWEEKRKKEGRRGGGVGA